MPQPLAQPGRFAWFTLALALTAALGCKGCDTGGKAPAATDERQVQAESARLHARLDARKIDRSKVYPKAADGTTNCGTDKDCFIVQADACAKAELSYRQDMSGFGAVHRVDFVYRIDGKEAGKCKATRRVSALGVQLSPGLIQVLHEKQGKTDEDIRTMKDDAETALYAENPTLVECWFEQNVMLGAALDLADGRYMPQVWRDACREVASNAPVPADAFESPATGDPTGGGTGGAGGR